MRVLLRLLLIGAAVALAVRFLLAILFPPARRVRGTTKRTSRSRIEEDRIQDAVFKDIQE